MTRVLVAGIGNVLRGDDGFGPAVIEALRQLHVLAPGDLSALSSYAPTPITNRRGERVGEARASFMLKIEN